MDLESLEAEEEEAADGLRENQEHLGDVQNTAEGPPGGEAFAWTTHIHIQQDRNRKEGHL